MNTTSFKAIKRQPAEQLTADELRRLITSGHLLPGTRVTEANLAEQFEVSRGTVRIALHQLCQEGLIVQTPYTGWTVMSIFPKDVWELYTLRAALESMAARLAAERLTEAGAERLRQAWRELEQACRDGEPQAVVAEKDFNIHKTIVELADHSRLLEQYRMVEQQVRLFVASTYGLSRSADEPAEAPPSGQARPIVATVLLHHKPIVDAVLARDAEAAARLIGEHTSSEGEKLFKHLDDILSLGTDRSKTAAAAAGAPRQIVALRAPRAGAGKDSSVQP